MSDQQDAVVEQLKKVDTLMGIIRQGSEDPEQEYGYVLGMLATLWNLGLIDQVEYLDKVDQAEEAYESAPNKRPTELA